MIERGVHRKEYRRRTPPCTQTVADVVEIELTERLLKE
jgi:hypothetical protein